MTASSGETAVLLTATVTPNVDTLLALKDPELRLNQYRHAISFWCQLTARSQLELHIVETSNASADLVLKHLAKQDRARVHFQSIDGGTLATDRGKGHVEFQAIRAYDRITGLFNATTTVFKATGRLVVANAHRIIVSPPSPSFVVRGTIDGTYIDSRFFGASSELWPGLISTVTELSDDSKGVFAEHALAAHVARARIEHKAEVLRFAKRPEISGMSGTAGVTYRPHKVPFERYFEQKLASFAHKKQV